MACINARHTAMAETCLHHPDSRLSIKRRDKLEVLWS